MEGKRPRLPQSSSDPAARAEAVARGGPSLAGVRVLVVDDEKDTREGVCALLLRHDAEVRAVSSAREALAVVREWLPHLAISDICMREQDGYALLRALRASEDERLRRLPVVALTAYARVEDRLRALSAGFQIHVPKPVEPLQLVTAVAKVADPKSVRLH
jgi:hypothetical protein